MGKITLIKNHATPKLVLFDFSLSEKAAPHECVIRTGPL